MLRILLEECNKMIGKLVYVELIERSRLTY